MLNYFVLLNLVFLWTPTSITTVYLGHLHKSIYSLLMKTKFSTSLKFKM
jgi:hypothetical protein